MNTHAAGLESVLITDRLNRRQRRQSGSIPREQRALAGLARHVQRDPARAPQVLARAALDLCRGGSAGVSVLRRMPYDDYLEWRAVAGWWASWADVATPRRFSPCGTALETGEVQLFYCPGRHFTYLNGLGAPVVELLVTPIRSGTDALGTLWVASHDPAPGRRHAQPRQFNSDDVRVTTGLAALAVTALQRLMAQPATPPHKPDTPPAVAGPLIKIVRRLAASIRGPQP